MKRDEYYLYAMRVGVIILLVMSLISFFGCTKKSKDEDKINCWKCNVYREEIKNDPDGTVYTETGNTKYEVCGTDDEIKKNHIGKRIEGNNWFEYTTCKIKW